MHFVSFRMFRRPFHLGEGSKPILFRSEGYILFRALMEGLMCERRGLEKERGGGLKRAVMGLPFFSIFFSIFFSFFSHSNSLPAEPSSLPRFNITQICGVKTSFHPFFEISSSHYTLLCFYEAPLNSWRWNERWIFQFQGCRCCQSASIPWGPFSLVDSLRRRVSSS